MGENEAILNSNFKINNSPSPEKITSYISESPSAITEVGRDSNNLNSDNNNYNNVNDEDDFMNLYR
ncbi:210_t:CDS:2 [Entrophospora sp. SA101]|nr:10342_t:CDS:2 [Entrophospora sp. SA101]CAJ0637851.1 210_t:CDS:2 [Entrophospora sp. SA101]